MYYWGGRIHSAIEALSGWIKNHLDMRHINRRKSNLIAYLWGIHTDTEISKTLKQHDACMKLRGGMEFEVTKGRKTISKKVKGDYSKTEVPIM